MLDEILNHPHLLHWYAENLDEGGSPHRSPLPLGLVFPDGLPDSPLPDAPGLAQRDLKVFCAHRHRDGAQWQLRRDLSKLAQGQWREFCTVPEGEISEAAFVAEIHRHTFVLCAEGGGLDPSPKAWLALLHGAIPIIRRTPLEAAYAHLPVVMVEAWDAESLSVEKLAAWRNELLPWFDDMERRREVLRRLTTDYWWNIISATIPIAATAAIACKSDQ